MLAAMNALAATILVEPGAPADVMPQAIQDSWSGLGVEQPLAGTPTFQTLLQQLHTLVMMLPAMTPAPPPTPPAATTKPEAPALAKPPAPEKEAPIKAPEPSKPQPRPEEGGSGPLLRRGAKGEPVAKLQRRLKELGVDPGPIDGDFGPRTENAVRKYQKQQDLDSDGVVGPKTWNKLGIDVKGEVVNADRPATRNSDDHKDIGGPQPAVVRQGKYIGADIADPFDRMVAAAQKAGVQLIINSGYRTHAEQQALWNAHPDPKWVARPGTSNHEKGQAIDFANVGNAWAWLKAHAGQFGFKNYPPEPWHYSLTGS